MNYEDMLGDLGLGEISIGAVEAPEPLAAVDTAWGFHGPAPERPPAVDEAWRFQNDAVERWSAVRLPDLLASGIALEESIITPRVYRLSPVGEGWRVVPDGAPGTRITTDLGVIVTTNELTRAVALLYDVDHGVAVFPPQGPGRREPGFGTFVRGPLVRPPELDVDPPATLWGDALDADPWLAEVVREMGDTGHAWDRVAAVGLVARHSGSELAGADDEPARRVGVWAAELPRPQRDALAVQAIEEARLISVGLEELAQEPDPEDDVWVDEIMEIMRRRDELEGVRWVLAQAGGSDAFERVLAIVDADARALLDALPRWDVGWDEHIPRAALIAPDAWWTAPASWSDVSEADRAWVRENARANDE